MRIITVRAPCAHHTNITCFVRVGLGFLELHNFELVGVGKNNCWSKNGVDILYLEPMHSVQFSDVYHEVQRDCRSYGRVSSQLGII